MLWKAVCATQTENLLSEPMVRWGGSGQTTFMFDAGAEEIGIIRSLELRNERKGELSAHSPEHNLGHLSSLIKSAHSPEHILRHLSSLLKSAHYALWLRAVGP